MLPSLLVRQVQSGIREYMHTTFPISNPAFEYSIDTLFDDTDTMYLEPYIRLRLPFRPGQMLEGLFETLPGDFQPYAHQQKAFERLVGDDGRSTIIATGTGSGKTECFLYPILEYCYQHRKERCVKALVIYPMNALATDQAGRFAEEIWKNDKLRGNVTVGMYVGGKNDQYCTTMGQKQVITDRDTMREYPPDILLTNYKMLDLLLNRPKDARLWAKNVSETSLKYVVVDELHTFDGAQGTDLACLLRRLKSRLRTDLGYLCCIGTSATMGDEKAADGVLDYAKHVFGEDFDPDSVIMEDRLTAKDFFKGVPRKIFTLPTPSQAAELADLTGQDDPEVYLQKAFSVWFGETFGDDASSVVNNETFPHQLPDLLKQHTFFQDLITLTEGQSTQYTPMAQGLLKQYPALGDKKYAQTVFDSLFALVSAARTGTPERPRPFLTVQIQLWLRELRRMVANVAADHVRFDSFYTLNKDQLQKCLPVVNCRDCGATGWATIMNERRGVMIGRLESFYNTYFTAPKNVVLMFPGTMNPPGPGVRNVRICPECLHPDLTNYHSHCEICGAEMISVVWHSDPTVTGGQIHCPFCGSRHGLALMGLRNTTEISTCISEIFASRFNQDKKILAFSDNVQDAAHRAGFFNSRTWRFTLRRAIQHVIQEAGPGENLEAFQDIFLNYWHEQMPDEADFIGMFVPPNMMWKRACEQILHERRFRGNDSQRDLLRDIERRLRYEILLEYGMRRHIGRTLPKSGCSILAFDPEIIRKTGELVRQRVVNELGAPRICGDEIFTQMTARILDALTENGGFCDPVFEHAVKVGSRYLLANQHLDWLPGQAAHNLPTFVNSQGLSNGRRNEETHSGLFDSISHPRYTRLLRACWPVLETHRTFLEDDTFFESIAVKILEELEKARVVLPMDSPGGKVFGLNKRKMYLSTNVRQMRCDRCGFGFPVAEENAQFWEGSPCTRKGCSGHFDTTEMRELDFHSRLFRNGDLVRVCAKEHTSLLTREDRESVEKDFKDKTPRPWDPNVLSCTPTLEMGINIGDLSTVIMCNIPPTPAQFVQRAGRGGRTDGNSLTLVTAANARPHDLYFYANPGDMVNGYIKPPRVFLNASAVLERQFIAFCLDTWVKRCDLDEHAVPDSVKEVLVGLKSGNPDQFPNNFISYTEKNRRNLLDSFFRMFPDELDGEMKKEFEKNVSVGTKLVEAFGSLQHQLEGLKERIQQVRQHINYLNEKPKDSAFEKDKRDLEVEIRALHDLQDNMTEKNLFNFFADEGLLPNYAFPEAGLFMKAILHHDSEAKDQENDQHPKRTVYEYCRPAQSALREFAPNNNFYANGHKLKIDQLDLTTAEITDWRFCPNCSHMEMDRPESPASACPRCGSPEWADIGQTRPMLKVQTVFSNTKYSESFIADESDDRTNTFFSVQTLIDVDENEKINVVKAFQLENGDFPFGYEFVKKATIREINFGEMALMGPQMRIDGTSDIRSGFRVCKYCGKIQPRNGKEEHMKYCSTWQDPTQKNDAICTCMFLYREFTTEALRILIPATTLDTTNERVDSFASAFLLGLTEYFGNVDHLQAQVTEIPIPETNCRKQYLVLYDSVPGGTGYLKEMQQKDVLFKIFEKALAILETCICKDQPEVKACYHCLYGYRQSPHLGNISRATAAKLLKSILSRRTKQKKIPKLDDISVSSLFDSELESRFIAALPKQSNAERKIEVSRAIIDGQEGFELKITIHPEKEGDEEKKILWEILPQYFLGQPEGTTIPCRPDFLFRLVGNETRKPIAVFLDGFHIHKDHFADDFRKRNALHRSGKYRIWSFSWKDVQDVWEPQGNYAWETLLVQKMPSHNLVYQNTIKAQNATDLFPDKAKPLTLFVSYLTHPRAEEVFTGQAQAYALSLLKPGLPQPEDFQHWTETMRTIFPHTELDATPNKTPWLIGEWPFETYYLKIYAGLSGIEAQQKHYTSTWVGVALSDTIHDFPQDLEREWNGLLHFSNLLQFMPNFAVCCTSGQELTDSLEENKTDSNIESPSEGNSAANGSPTDHIDFEKAWDSVEAMLFLDEAKEFAHKARSQGIPAPDEVGVEWTETLTVEMMWTSSKKAFLTKDQLPNRKVLEEEGWEILE